MTDLFQDGRVYLSSFNRAERYSFLLVVSRSMQDILAPHLKARSHSLSTLGILTIIIIAGAYFIASGLGRHGKLFGALVVSNDKNRSLITRLEDEKGRAFLLAAHDHLTGLPNRRTFTELAMSHLATARQHRGHYVLMYLDLDRFKLVNDTLGHHVGDILLQTVAIRLRASLRDSDIVARLGGDEFAILLTGLASVDDLPMIADKIISQVSQPFKTQDGQEIHVSPSIGIAVFPRDGQDFDSLCKNADAAMYESKRKGRSTYTYYDTGLNSTSERRFNLEQRLPKAIAEDELVLHFQPKVNLSDFRIVGFEALVRWQHPELGLVYPDDFIPLAEETGLIVELGEWVARSCCRQQAAWQAEGLDCVALAINMSPLQLQREELPSRIESLLTEHDVPADVIEIEITETVLLKSLEATVMVLRRLEALGVQISLDDFGSGFSSLSYVRTLPIHIIKIDKQFIRDIRNSTHDGVLVASIISLAHNLGMQVIAEGVETLEQLIYLKTAGCDQAQGYYFSRPVPAASARDLLRNGVLAPS
ncbi:GGDEF-domain containing protein [Pollutimonas subterranea]|uniref:GGDEF-domain containing protein n=2 Tax=Pollutimonas subterranea TaxID=2045210 RepID=A0A2N4TZ34_9BURK|nr:GGDEF-domain containing protein [Pollutimonas subterranea]